jgi:hypothetical protein
VNGSLIALTGAVTLSAASTISTQSLLVTPAAGSPNPAPGYIVINLANNYNAYLGGFSGFVSPLSGSNITSGLTVGVPYVITSLGSSTAAQWQTAGLSSTITPALGASFIAKATSVAGGGAVQAVLAGGSGINHMEVIGDANQMNSNNPSSSGKQIIVACYSASGTVTAPANGSVIGMAFYLNDSSVPVGTSA